MAKKPQLEFTDGRAPFDLGGKQTIIGRGGSSNLRLEAPGVAEQHARLVLDAASGNVWIEDLKSQTGTLRNGQKLTGKSWLADGDKVTIGAVTLIYRPDGAPVAAPRPMAEQATMMSAEPPAAVKELIARQAALDAQKAAAAKAKAAPEPDDGRTQLQMAAPVIPVPAQAPAAAPARKATVMGLGGPSAPAQPAKLPPAPQHVPDSANPFATQAEMQAPVIPGNVPDSANPFASQSDLPATGNVPDSANPFATQAEMQAPVIPAPRPQPQAQKPQPRNTSPAAFDSTGWGTAPAQAAPPPQKPVQQAQGTMPVMAAPSGSAFGVGGSPPGQPMPMQQQPMGPQGNFQPIAEPPPAQGFGQPMGGAPAYGQPMQQPMQQPSPTTGQQPMVPMSSQPYSPPKKGSFGSISRALEFYSQIFSLAMKNKSLLTPLVYDLLITTVLSILLCAADFFIASDTIYYLLLSVGTGMLYFIDYFCNSLTASLIYDQVTTGQSSAKNAWPRVTKALPGILTFAAISAVLDIASTYARERRDVLSRILLDILRRIWSTATYVIMPALVIEGVPFGTAFKRSKDLMKQDPTGVGAGIVAMSITSYFVGIVMFGLAGFSMRFLGRFVHPALGMFFFFFFCNAFWAVSGWMKIAYSTCFYMWARECEKANSTDHSLAPLPLRSALDAA
jgi:hypothetical protein